MDKITFEDITDADRRIIEHAVRTLYEGCAHDAGDDWAREDVFTFCIEHVFMDTPAQLWGPARVRYRKIIKNKDLQFDERFRAIMMNAVKMFC